MRTGVSFPVMAVVLALGLSVVPAETSAQSSGGVVCFPVGTPGDPPAPVGPGPGGNLLEQKPYFLTAEQFQNNLALFQPLSEVLDDSAKDLWSGQDQYILGVPHDGASKSSDDLLILDKRTFDATKGLLDLNATMRLKSSAKVDILKVMEQLQDAMKDGRSNVTIDLVR